MNPLKETIASGAVILDVRTPEEFAQGAYPHAINIPVQELPMRLNEVPRGRPIVAYCRSGKRSEMAAQMLAQAGFEPVYNGGGLDEMP